MGRLSIKTRIILFFRTISLKLDYAVKIERRIAYLNRRIKCLEQYIDSSGNEYKELYMLCQIFWGNHTKMARKLVNDLDRVAKMKINSDFESDWDDDGQC